MTDKNRTVKQLKYRMKKKLLKELGSKENAMKYINENFMLNGIVTEIVVY